MGEEIHKVVNRISYWLNIVIYFRRAGLSLRHPILFAKNNLVQTISIKSGLVYEGKKFKNTSKKLYYPGEVILSNIPVKKLSFCEHLVGKTQSNY
jgi:hypothetical protein